MTSVDPRFDGIARLYGREALARLRTAHACVVGVGGVGSWTVEALARSGVGHLTLIDLDDICASNTNRQLHTRAETIGQFKVEVLAERVRSINPEIQVTPRLEFFTERNADAVLDTGFDVVVDAIDAPTVKAILIAGCARRQVPVITTGGAGGRIDPTAVRIDDLGDTKNDRLLVHVRKMLRQRHGYPKGRKTPPMGIRTVWSTEAPRFPTANGGVCDAPEAAGEGPRRLDCEFGFGAASFVTGTMGFAAASAAIAAVLQLTPAQAG